MVKVVSIQETIKTIEKAIFNLKMTIIDLQLDKRFNEANEEIKELERLQKRLTEYKL